MLSVTRRFMKKKTKNYEKKTEKMGGKEWENY